MDVPAPDESKPPGLAPGQTLIELLYAEDRQVRGVIARDSQNLYRVSVERWDVGDLEYIGYAYWAPWGLGVSLTDDLHTAREIAANQIAITPRSIVTRYVEE